MKNQKIILTKETKKCGQIALIDAAALPGDAHFTVMTQFKTEPITIASFAYLENDDFSRKNALKGAMNSYDAVLREHCCPKNYFN